MTEKKSDEGLLWLSIICTSIFSSAPVGAKNSPGRRKIVKYGKLNIESKSEIKIINDVESFVKFDT